MSHPDLEAALTELARNLSDEIAVQQAIHDCLLRESEALVQGDLEALRRVVDDLEPHVTKRNALAEDRDLLRQALSVSLGVEKGQVNMTRVLAAAQPLFRESLRELRNALGREISSVSEANRTAARLLYPSLQVTRAFLRAISGAPPVSAYGATGLEPPAEPRPFFERRA
jgi:hypothetical protein